jgi:hypothetical protein
MVKEVVKLLNKFWERFKVVIKDHTISPRDILTMFKSSETETGYEKISLINKICFTDWPCDKYTGGQINIVIDYCLILKKNEKQAQKVFRSCAEILFFPNESNCDLNAFFLRFDYHPWEGSDDGDPLFHVQMDSKPKDISWLPEPILKKWPTTCSIIKSQLKNYIRIPTPRMFFPDLMYFIVADHLRSSVHELIRHTKDIVTEFDKIMYDESIRKEKKFWEIVQCANWYQKLNKETNKENQR